MANLAAAAVVLPGDNPPPLPAPIDPATIKAGDKVQLRPDALPTGYLVELRGVVLVVVAVSGGKVWVRGAGGADLLVDVGSLMPQRRAVVTEMFVNLLPPGGAIERWFRTRAAADTGRVAGRLGVLHVRADGSITVDYLDDVGEQVISGG